MKYWKFNHYNKNLFYIQTDYPTLPHIVHYPKLMVWQLQLLETLMEYIFGLKHLREICNDIQDTIYQ